MPANPEKGPVFGFWSHIAEVLVYRAGGVLKKTDPELLVLHSIVSHQYQLILRHWCKTNLLFSYVVVISLYMKPYQHNRKMSAWNYVQMQLFILILNWFHALHFICCIIIFSFVSQWGFFFLLFCAFNSFWCWIWLLTCIVFQYCLHSPGSPTVLCQTPDEAHLLAV